MLKTFYNYISFYKSTTIRYSFQFSSCVDYLFKSLTISSFKIWLGFVLIYNLPSRAFPPLPQLFKRGIDANTSFFPFSTVFQKREYFFKFISNRQFFFFNPFLYRLFNFTSVTLRKKNRYLDFNYNVTSKSYYCFVKGRINNVFKFSKFLSVNFIMHNTNNIVSRSALFANFFSNLATIDFRSVFSSFLPFYGGDYYDSSDTLVVEFSELFDPSFVFENSGFFTADAEALVEEQYFFPFEQFDLLVYDDKFDYRVQHRVFSRTAYLSLFPASSEAFSKLYSLVSSNFIAVLGLFHNQSFACKTATICSNRANLFSSPAAYFGLQAKIGSGARLSSQELIYFINYSRLILIRSIVLLVWDLYYRDFEFFLSTINSLYFLSQKFSQIGLGQVNLFEFIEFFIGANINFQFFSKITEDSLKLFLQTVAQSSFLSSSKFSNKRDLEVFLSKFLFNFSKKLESLRIETLSSLFSSLSYYSDFVNRTFHDFAITDPFFKTNFVNFLSSCSSKLNIDPLSKRFLKKVLSDFTAKYSSGVSISHFLVRSQYDRIFNGLDFTYLDNPDFIISEFEFLFRQIRSFEYFISLELNLLALITGVISGFDNTFDSQVYYKVVLPTPQLGTSFVGLYKSVKDYKPASIYFNVFQRPFVRFRFKQTFNFFASFIFCLTYIKFITFWYGYKILLYFRFLFILSNFFFFGFLFWWALLFFVYC